MKQSRLEPYPRHVSNVDMQAAATGLTRLPLLRLVDLLPGVGNEGNAVVLLMGMLAGVAGSSSSSSYKNLRAFSIEVELLVAVMVYSEVYVGAGIVKVWYAVNVSFLLYQGMDKTGADRRYKLPTGDTHNTVLRSTFEVYEVHIILS
jgi:hypothetical protein